MRKSRLLILTAVIYAVVAIGLMITPAYSGVNITVTKTLYQGDIETTNANDNHRIMVLTGYSSNNHLSVWDRMHLSYTGAYIDTNGNGQANAGANKAEQLARFSDEEVEFLQNLYFDNPASKIDYFIDLTTHSVVIKPDHYIWNKNSIHNIQQFQNHTDGPELIDVTQQLNQIDTNLFMMTITQTYSVTNHTFQLLNYWCESPIVLDLDNNNKIDTALNKWQAHDPTFYRDYAKFFDIDGDGKDDYTEWMKADPSDALLVMPEDGKVETALQLFGTAGGYTDGYEKLSIVCDTDKNGWVEGRELEGLALWIDRNNNARCEEDELHNLSEFGVEKIATSHDAYKSVYKTADGQTRTTWDWWPSVAEIRKFR
ncbi:MAG: hypothetical protein ACLFQV_02810 [Vulcanimicrobiota bacterium]